MLQLAAAVLRLTHNGRDVGAIASWQGGGRQACGGSCIEAFGASATQACIPGQDRHHHARQAAVQQITSLRFSQQRAAVCMERICMGSMMQGLRQATEVLGVIQLC